MNTGIRPENTESIPFIIKEFHYNRYSIDHRNVKGILNLANIVINVGKIPNDMIPPEQMPSEGILIGLSYQPIVAFINQGEKKTPTELPDPRKIPAQRKLELGNYVIEEENYEPWNKYVLGIKPPKLLKTRTILTKVECVIDTYNNLGDPYILVSHNTGYSVLNTDVPESGLR